jgi:hypothetical protein
MELTCVLTSAKRRMRGPVRTLTALAATASVLAFNTVAQTGGAESKKPEQEAPPFRPEIGTFAPLEKAHPFRGELVFVDHVNRRGSLRVTGGSEVFFQHRPQPFALLPYGVVRFHNAPADLRNIPLGTLLHASGFLPPDPANSAVPVVQKPTIEQPAENHLLLLEDEPSHCIRIGKVWRLKEVDVQKHLTKLTATLEPKETRDTTAPEQILTLDNGTRIWRGREALALRDMIADGLWPAEGKRSLDGLPVQLGLSWLPAGTWENRVENQFHITDIWLDEAAMQRSSELQTGLHKSLIRSRLMPAYVDAVEYGKFGRATATVTLFGGMDASLYADFKKGEQGVIVSAEATLKPWSSIVSSSHIGSKGTILDVSKSTRPPSLGNSGIQVRMDTDLIIEGIRPGKIVRIRPASWPHVSAPREEYLIDPRIDSDDRFPTPAIFPKY